MTDGGDYTYGNKKEKRFGSMYMVFHEYEWFEKVVLALGEN